MTTIEKVAHPVIFEFNSAAARLRKQGRRVLNLGQAVPDYTPPAELVRRALAEPAPFHTYTPDEGFAGLRGAVAASVLGPDGAHYAPDTELLITAGANHAYFLAVCAVTDPGDEVVLFTPGYFNHKMTLELLGRVPAQAPLRETDRWEFDPEAFTAALTPRTKAVTLVNPNNPTGTVFPRETVEFIAAECARRGLWLISDEVYDRYCYDIPRFRPASLYKDCTITLGSFSKSLGLMGWRIGYIAAPEKVIAQAVKAQDTSIVCACNAGQCLAERLINDGAWPQNDYIESLKARRQVLREGLAAIPRVSWRTPEGAMFAAVRINSPFSAHQTALRLLSETGVITIPCEAFGKGGENHLRLSFGFLSEAEIRSACELMAGFFAGFKNLD